MLIRNGMLIQSGCPSKGDAHSRLDQRGSVPISGAIRPFPGMLHRQPSSQCSGRKRSSSALQPSSSSDGRSSRPLPSRPLPLLPAGKKSGRTGTELITEVTQKATLCVQLRSKTVSDTNQKTNKCTHSCCQGTTSRLKHGMGSWEAVAQTLAHSGVLSCHLTCYLWPDPAPFAPAFHPRWQRKTHRAQGCPCLSFPIFKYSQRGLARLCF